MEDNRTWLKNKIKRYAETYEDDSLELKTANKIKTFIDQNKDCFLRSNTYGHITGSSWIVNESFDSFLLHYHRKLRKWLQLGGHADGESNILKVSLDEAREESGLLDFKVLSEDIFDVDAHLIPKRKGEPEHFHFDVRFLLQASSSAPLSCSVRESIGLAWVSISDVLEKSDYDNVRKMAIKSEMYRKR